MTAFHKTHHFTNEVTTKDIVVTKMHIIKRDTHNYHSHFKKCNDSPYKAFEKTAFQFF